MRRQMLYVTLPVCLAIVAAGAWLANAGDLNPPAGPVTPTMLTLDDLANAIQSISGGDVRTDVLTLPGSASALHVIDQPGSYYLSANITGESGKSGIEIAASGVTLDLNGFELLGVTGSLNGVGAPAAIQNISIQDGTAQGWGQAGVDLLNATGGRISSVHARGNASYGIAVRDGFVIADCTAHANGSHGIRARWQYTILRCTSNSNAGGTGIWTEALGNIIGCTANFNGNDGISGGEGCVIKNCSANQNASDGIRSYSAATISTCAVYSNSGDGIDAGLGSSITSCTAVFNDRNGIYAQNDCVVLNNVCANNNETGMAGIRLGYNNRAEGNHLRSNTIGIRADQDDDNLIIKNSADGNTTNYDIATGNHYGQIILSPGAGFSNSNPWANFSWDEG